MPFDASLLRKMLIRHRSGSDAARAGVVAGVSNVSSGFWIGSKHLAARKVSHAGNYSFSILFSKGWVQHSRRLAMKRIVPNIGPTGNDLCLDPIAIRIPILLIDNGLDCFWYPHALDEASAKRVAFSLGNHCDNEVTRLNVDLILPSANVVCSMARRLDSPHCRPVRATLETGGERK